MTLNVKHDQTCSPNTASGVCRPNRMHARITHVSVSGKHDQDHSRSEPSDANLPHLEKVGTVAGQGSIGMCVRRIKIRKAREQRNPAPLSGRPSCCKVVGLILEKGIECVFDVQNIIEMGRSFAEDRTTYSAVSTGLW